MRSNATHVLAARWSRLATDVERTFFRIERESRWLAGAINGSIAGAAVALIAWLVSNQEGNLLMFACLGSSAASVVFAPLAKNNSLRTIVLAYLEDLEFRHFGREFRRDYYGKEVTVTVVDASSGES